MKEKELLQKKKFEKDQLKKKKQIAEYKQKKLEAEEILANADIDFDDEDLYGQEQSSQMLFSNAVNQNQALLGAHGAKYDSQNGTGLMSSGGSQS